MTQGVVYGDYLLLGRLAMGGMAEVFLAKRLLGDSSEGLLALKRTLPQLAENIDFLSMFADEARIAQGLEHPHICRVVGHGKVGEQMFIAMEFIHGKDLKVVHHRAMQRGEPIPYRYVAFALAKIARALDVAHNKLDAKGECENIVHRDISPQNILLSYDGVPKLIDFGIAKAKDRIAQTRVGIVKGKFAYMSPEQAIGAEIDWRTDVFALGVTLYELLTGQLPFKGSSDFSTLKRIARAEYQPPDEINADIPPRLVRIVQRSLERDRTKRYDTAEKMAQDLERFLVDEGRSVEFSSVSAFMRKLFRDDYIRESARIRDFHDIKPPEEALARAKKRESALKSRADVTIEAEDVQVVELEPEEVEDEPEANEATVVAASLDLAAGFEGSVTGLSELLGPEREAIAQQESEPSASAPDTDDKTDAKESPLQAETEDAEVEARAAEFIELHTTEFETFNTTDEVDLNFEKDILEETTMPVPFPTKEPDKASTSTEAEETDRNEALAQDTAAKPLPTPEETTPNKVTPDAIRDSTAEEMFDEPTVQIDSMEALVAKMGSAPDSPPVPDPNGGFDDPDDRTREMHSMSALLAKMNEPDDTKLNVDPQRDAESGFTEDTTDEVPLPDDEDLAPSPEAEARVAEIVEQFSEASGELNSDEVKVEAEEEIDVDILHIETDDIEISEFEVEDATRVEPSPEEAGPGETIAFDVPSNDQLIRDDSKQAALALQEQERQEVHAKNRQRASGQIVLSEENGAHDFAGVSEPEFTVPSELLEYDDGSPKRRRIFLTGSEIAVLFVAVLLGVSVLLSSYYVATRGVPAFLDGVTSPPTKAAAPIPVQEVPVPTGKGRTPNQ